MVNCLVMWCMTFSLNVSSILLWHQIMTSNLTASIKLHWFWLSVHVMIVLDNRATNHPLIMACNHTQSRRRLSVQYVFDPLFKQCSISVWSDFDQWSFESISILAFSFCRSNFLLAICLDLNKMPKLCSLEWMPKHWWSNASKALCPWPFEVVMINQLYHDHQILLTTKRNMSLLWSLNFILHYYLK